MTISKCIQPVTIKDIFDANIGDTVGVVNLPGEFPYDKKAIIIEKVENKWGRHLVVKRENGDIDTVNGFYGGGIGWYYFGKL